MGSEDKLTCRGWPRHRDARPAECRFQHRPGPVLDTLTFDPPSILTSCECQRWMKIRQRPKKKTSKHSNTMNMWTRRFLLNHKNVWHRPLFHCLQESCEKSATFGFNSHLGQYYQIKKPYPDNPKCDFFSLCVLKDLKTNKLLKPLDFKAAVGLRDKSKGNHWWFDASWLIWVVLLCCLTLSPAHFSWEWILYCGLSGCLHIHVCLSVRPLFIYL